MKHQRRYHTGFTLIELIAATALAVILMIGVLATFQGIVRDRTRLASARSVESSDRAMAVELLRRDLSCASDIQTDSAGTVEVHTCSSLDVQTLETNDRPSLVSYEIADSDGLHALVREQQLEDE